MKKEDLLKNIAETGYNVGFGAKKHFATYDLVEKIPGILGFISISIGIFALFVDALTTKYLSASLIVFGVMGLTINFYNHKKGSYTEIGTKLTILFNELKFLYYEVKNSKPNAKFADFEKKRTQIESTFNSISIPDQILFSDWYAHYKFFWQHQIDWIDEQIHFSFFRDKIPLSFMLIFFSFLGGFLVLGILSI